VAFLEIYYFNDETRVISVQLGTKDGTFYEMLNPREGKLFTLEVPEGAIPWIKKWDYPVVLLSYCKPEDLPQSTKDPS
jgi:hypothetical protein